MANNGLDKEYSCLKLLNKALFQEKLISREVFEIYDNRYSRKIVADSCLEAKMSLEQRQAKQKLDEKTRFFSMVLDQWHIHGPDWKAKMFTEAEKWKDQIENARLVLDLR